MTTALDLFVVFLRLDDGRQVEQVVEAVDEQHAARRAVKTWEADHPGEWVSHPRRAHRGEPSNRGAA